MAAVGRNESVQQQGGQRQPGIRLDVCLRRNTPLLIDLSRDVAPSDESPAGDDVEVAAVGFVLVLLLDVVVGSVVEAQEAVTRQNVAKPESIRRIVGLLIVASLAP